MTDTYVITGGAGFIGSHIAERLLREGHSVRIVDDFSTGKRENFEALDGDITLHTISITDLDALRPVFAGARYVFHQAALASVPRSIADPLSTHHANITGTLNVLLAARDAGVERVVYAGSSSAYGDSDVDYKVETLLPQPLSPYGVTKLAAEYYCQAFTQVYGLSTVTLRYFNVFGPRQDETSQYAAVIPKFVAAMMTGQQPTIYGDGTQSRDFTYIDNVVHGNLLALTAPDVSGEVINLALGGSVTLLDLAARINRLLGTRLTPIHTPPKTGDILHSRAGIDKAIDLLDFAPIVDFDTGLQRTVDWFRQRSAVNS